MQSLTLVIYVTINTGPVVLQSFPFEYEQTHLRTVKHPDMDLVYVTLAGAEQVTINQSIYLENHRDVIAYNVY